MINPDQDNVKQTLVSLEVLASKGLISREQVLSVFPKEPKKNQVNFDQKISLQKITYYIGGLIVLMGIVVFVAQFWSEMDQFAKVFITLGSAVSAYSLGYYFFHSTPSKEFGLVFFVISIALFPLGLATTIDSMGISSLEPAGMSLNAALLFLIFLSSYMALRANLFLPFSVFAGSFFFFSFTDLLFKDLYLGSEFFNYRFLILGTSYLALGYYFGQNNKRFMVNIMYVFGLLMLLGSSLALQGFRDSNPNYFWQAVYPGLLMISYWLSVRLQSKAFLLMATIFTFLEVIKLTIEYFSDSIGWSLSLIIAGLIVMGAGYISFELHKKFFARTPTNLDNI